MADKKSGPLVLTGIANYLYCFKPRKDEDEPEKEGAYQCTISWDKDNTAQTSALKKRVQEAAVEKWGTKAVDLLKRGKIQSPLRDGDESDDENFHDCWTATARRKESLGRPGVVDEDVQPILDSTDIYSGCEINLSASVFPYDYKGKRGVGLGFNHVQKVADGERRGGGTRPEDDFKPLSGKKSKGKKQRPVEDDEDDSIYD